MKTRISLFLVATALTVASASAGVLYTIDDANNSLYTVNQTTGAVTLVGYTGVASGDFGDLSYNPLDGKLYWVPGRDNNSLYTIDPSTGTATLVGAHGLDDLFALAWDTTNNVLYAEDSNSNFYTLDPTTAAPTLVGNNGVYPGGLAYNSFTDILLLLESGSDNFYQVNRGTGATTFAGGGTQNVNDNGVTYNPDDNSYWVASWNSSLYHYDASFNQLTAFPQADVFDGIAYVSSGVPEPGTFPLLAGGLTAAAFLRRRLIRKPR